MYWQDIRDTVVALPSQIQARRFVLNVLILIVPAEVLCLQFGKAIEAHLFAPVAVSAYILWVSSLRSSRCIARQLRRACL